VLARSADLTAALVASGWEEAALQQALKHLPPDAEGGNKSVTLDAFLPAAIAAGVYKSEFAT
jgi:hypothetical protein